MGKKQRERQPQRRVRVRGKRLDQIDETKLSLALWLVAKQIVDDRTDEDDSRPPRPESSSEREAA